MNKLLYDGKIKFDDFQLYREAENSSGCEYGYPSDNVNIEDYEEVNVYICPHCIKKYGLYRETETTEEQIYEVLKSQSEGNYDYYDLTCGIDGARIKILLMVGYQLKEVCWKNLDKIHISIPTINQTIVANRQ